MKIGIISDIHDDLEGIEKAIQVFRENGVSYVFHAGDYVSPPIVRKLGKGIKPAKLIGVLGNNDGERIGLHKVFQEVDGKLCPDLAEVPLEGEEVRIAMYHGTDERITSCIAKSQEYDVLIHGHTHIKKNELEGKTLVLNPGTTRKNFPNIEQKIEVDPAVIIYDSKTKEAKFVSLLEDTNRV